ncbi:hypothetical protein HYFRA_00009229 [Hymenoscyphus fraxineus]|uniref:Uncharacterized protein n=1 Tax=Hymenoscyphus fraxineus TaxID=746836 RepID=A0A9N9PSF8_9HELO|nr:hypothetical protein HYFRA_00009229 [Hymenoscyphus fraxineus]
MSSSAAFIVILALAGNALAAPAANDPRFNLAEREAYDDGQYHWKPSPITSEVDATYSEYVPIPTKGNGHPTSGVSASDYPFSQAPAPTKISTIRPGRPITTSKPAFPTFEPETTSVIVKTTKTAKESEPTDAVTSTTPTTPVAKKEFKGDGTPAQGWPGSDKWLSFDGLWNANEKNIKSSCQNGIPQNSEKENKNLKAAIQSVGKEAGVDPRFILAVVLQESHGCVRVEHTVSPGDSIHNPGLMQSHQGEFDCERFGSKECTNERIVGMIQEGSVHTKKPDGSGLKTGLETAKKDGSKSDAQSAYWSARLYNSGDFSYVKGGDLSSTVKAATASYSSDIANRLIGAVF